MKVELTENFTDLLEKGGAEKGIRILTYCKLFVNKFFKTPCDVVDIQQKARNGLITQAYEETKRHLQQLGTKK